MPLASFDLASLVLILLLKVLEFPELFLKIFSGGKSFWKKVSAGLPGFFCCCMNEYEYFMNIF